MSDVQYDQFLSRIYDDAPYFGQARSREPELFNGFYFKHLRDKTRRVLEFGSGTGMLTVPLARAGFLVDSVDISSSMQEVLAGKLRAEDSSVAKRVRQFTADALSYLGEEPYDSIVMPEGLVIALPDRALQIALFESCHRNLRKGGRIYADFVQPRYKVVYEQKLQEHTRFRTRDGDEYLLSVTFRNDRHSQVEEWDAVFARKGAPERIAVTVSFRFLFHSELQFMLERCGFKVIEIDVNHAGGLGFAVIAEKV
ncbi:bifunctional 2-polyprenyl-6-hydroxyphenol methylase/3-demethylubiquinol 3-O-methyltransferase UbiG [Myxococcus sp. AM010]|uniref:class I SAM-dependent methyltransferase n=1 Tax=Myxococcus sp. AM010 TaxID=2745138 RepID=UPI001595482A|nr:class I SAM-dependent methyltransferase [Myxococcus sp. AM010]NVJ12937.1 class I SAM-dependent methyltransferase [Myxococcus sp. AM010]